MKKLTREQVEKIVKAAREKQERPNLKGADLSDVYLNQTDLSLTDLGGANLSYARLSQANLSLANLSEANLSWAHLSEANLSGANLCRANLFGATLGGTNLSQADLSGANLCALIVISTAFINIDLSQVKGLDAVHHLGPSHIDTHTLQLSKGQIPAAFLRGCGLSDVQIEMAKLHNPDLTSEQVTAITYKIHELRVEKAIHYYYSCFISHAHQDHPFAQQLYHDLQESGVRCWFAPEDMKIGDKIRTTIDRSIRLHDKLLLILSQHSINSPWVEKEVETAFEEESKRHQTVLFPICLDQTIMHTDQAWAADIRRTRHIGDFSQWQDRASYQPGFERLLRDLAAGEETPPTLPPRFAERTKDDTIDSLHRQLARHRSSLNKLREDVAIYGAGEVPLRLQNQIEDKERKIAKIEAELAEIEGEGD